MLYLCCGLAFAREQKNKMSNVKHNLTDFPIVYFYGFRKDMILHHKQDRQRELTKFNHLRSRGLDFLQSLCTSLD